MRTLPLVALLLAASLCIAQSPCPSGYHHEGENATACWPDVSQQQAQANPAASIPGKATIIFYRPSAFYGSALKPSLYLDGKEVGRLRSGRYLTLETTEGEHALGSSKRDTTLPISLSRDETKYVEMVVQSGTWRGAGRLTIVADDEGKEKIKKLKPED